MPPTREEVKRIIQRMQKKDIYGIFREPVTDDMVRTGPWLPRAHTAGLLGLGAAWLRICGPLCSAGCGAVCVAMVPGRERRASQAQEARNGKASQNRWCLQEVTPAVEMWLP